MYVALLRGGNNVPSSAAVNFSQTQYSADGQLFGAGI